MNDDEDDDDDDEEDGESPNLPDTGNNLDDDDDDDDEDDDDNNFTIQYQRPTSATKGVAFGDSTSQGQQGEKEKETTQENHQNTKVKDKEAEREKALMLADQDRKWNEDRLKESQPSAYFKHHHQQTDERRITASLLSTIASSSPSLVSTTRVDEAPMVVPTSVEAIMGIGLEDDTHEQSRFLSEDKKQEAIQAQKELERQQQRMKEILDLARSQAIDTLAEERVTRINPIDAQVITFRKDEEDKAKKNSQMEKEGGIE
ncbi:rRNA biogenesis protein rrp36-like [Cynara cardunculus var. scolymus]|uniref:rRNA biogenesis protein rrp36-like n=1 Tax=Cynara cardunculus var. scolymus TaxID=59895 RepID=UPI000D62745E|nr:rRNA biogenesis protein rrp36-like [Cynara cardunculus var. scolymus]